MQMNGDMNAYLYTSSRAMHSEILNLLLPQVSATVHQSVEQIVTHQHFHGHFLLVPRETAVLPMRQPLGSAHCSSSCSPAGHHTIVTHFALSALMWVMRVRPALCAQEIGVYIPARTQSPARLPSPPSPASVPSPTLVGRAARDAGRFARDTVPTSPLRSRY